MKLLRNGGFTLVEVLTATAILVMACVLVLKVSTQVLDTWKNVSEKSSDSIEANLALDMLEEDLEAAFPHFWICKVDGGIRLCFYKQERKGEWRALAYQVGYDEVKKRHGLYRYEASEGRYTKNFIVFDELSNPDEKPLKGIITSSNLLAKNILNFSVHFLNEDDEGDKRWMVNPGVTVLPICAEITLTVDKERQITRRVPFLVNCKI